MTYVESLFGGGPISDSPGSTQPRPCGVAECRPAAGLVLRAFGAVPRLGLRSRQLNPAISLASLIPL